jgi:hypothetical protein
MTMASRWRKRGRTGGWREGAAGRRGACARPVADLARGGRQWLARCRSRVRGGGCQRRSSSAEELALVLASVRSRRSSRMRRRRAEGGGAMRRSR